MKETSKDKQTVSITCIVTGKARISNHKYLEAKAAKLGCAVGDVAKNYISRDAMKLLRAGKSQADVRAALSVGSDVPEVAESKLRKAVKLNGKQGKVAAPAVTAPAALPVVETSGTASA